MAEYPLLLDKSRKQKRNIRTYFELINLVINMKTITIPECNDLILWFWKVTRMNGKEIPLPARFSTILDDVMRNANPIQSRIRKQEFPLCQTLFPDDILSKLPCQQGVVTNIVKVVSKYILIIYICISYFLWIAIHVLLTAFHVFVNFILCFKSCFI